MKPFTKRLALVTGLLLTALLCLGVVFIDSTSVFWSVSSNLVRLTVSNTVSTITVHTNAPHGFGFNSNNITRSFIAVGRKPADNATGNGTTANVTGAMHVTGAQGGESTVPTTASGGMGGPVLITGGSGGSAVLATTNATGGNGAPVTIAGGAGSANTGGVATNATTGGAGADFTGNGGAGGSPAVASTNTVGGPGGGFNLNGGAAGVPSAGWARKGGAGGGFNMTATAGGAGVRTNGGNGGNLIFTAGSGGATTSGGDPGAAGNFRFTAGNGAVGDTNSNGGSFYLLPGINTAVAGLAGDVVLGRNLTGTSAGGVMVGPATANAVSITNLLGATATLDFPSIVAGTVADLPITVVNAADGDVVSLAVPIASVTNCVWMAWASNGVVYVRAANAQLVSAQDPNSGLFRVKVEKFR